ncbi:uncharacterized protein BO95DRAFT_391883 [Aspergillus brunneoviolaceus CBS 621.78]|uniref:Uncharacterized protein n=1 Tax=Aspergillus brunneoviolaceus CBS 621.78 TaxID=1450534 RepID=A0ACD1G5A2_9EURO|nr:hypothetical protein BO95DRAFT_391883 [Aspergillus brunneoviolaceus CBS 621.78]RAH44443.1 hypothetical protein BO95DRAFT_391883 [Aspergillus brunneoviolaceus CBS 621.78]
MKGLWSRVTPAQSTCRCVSCLSTVSQGVASRGATAASKKRLRLGNSVTALYTSIFAAAALADAQAKGQRRHEWEEKIAAAKGEVDALLDEEERLVEAIFARRDEGMEITPSRQTTTQARPRSYRYRWPSTNISRRSFHTSRNLALSKSNQRRDENSLEELNKISEDPLLEVTDEDNLWNLEDFDTPQWLKENGTRQKAIRKMALKQLAIRMLLRRGIAHSYQGLQMKYAVDYSMPAPNVPELLTHLNKLRNRMKSVKASPRSSIEDLEAEMNSLSPQDQMTERQRLDGELYRDTNLYLANRMSLQELLLRLANNLTKSTNPDRSLGLKHMLLAFTKTRENDICEMILHAIIPHKFPLTSSLIISILNFFRKSKNLKAFDLFLRQLAGDGYPLDMGNLGHYKNVVVNGIEIQVPPVDSANAVIYGTLIRSCLRFNQPDRADAYLQVSRASGYMDDYATLSSYLGFYAIRSDWAKGIQALQRTVAFIGSTTEHRPTRVERLIVKMVYLCDECEQTEISQKIIQAFVKSGFDWKWAEKQLDLTFERDPRYNRWKAAQTAAGTEAARASQQTMWEKCYSFVQAVGEQLDGLTTERASTTQWQDMMKTYAQDVLSAIISGPVAMHKAAKEGGTGDLVQDDRATLLKEISQQAHDIQQHNSAVVNAQKTEIASLQAEIAQLKRMVFDLHRTVTTSNPLPQTPSPPSSSPKHSTNTATSAPLSRPTPVDTTSPPPPPHVTVSHPHLPAGLAHNLVSSSPSPTQGEQVSPAKKKWTMSFGMMPSSKP